MEFGKSINTSSRVNPPGPCRNELCFSFCRCKKALSSHLLAPAPRLTLRSHRRERGAARLSLLGRLTRVSLMGRETSLFLLGGLVERRSCSPSQQKRKHQTQQTAMLWQWWQFWRMASLIRNIMNLCSTVPLSSALPLRPKSFAWSRGSIHPPGTAGTGLWWRLYGPGVRVSRPSHAHPTCFHCAYFAFPSPLPCLLFCLCSLMGSLNSVHFNPTHVIRQEDVCENTP